MDGRVRRGRQGHRESLGRLVLVVVHQRNGHRPARLARRERQRPRRRLVVVDGNRRSVRRRVRNSRRPAARTRERHAERHHVALDTGPPDQGERGIVVVGDRPGAPRVGEGGSLRIRKSHDECLARLGNVVVYRRHLNRLPYRVRLKGQRPCRRLVVFARDRSAVGSRVPDSDALCSASGPIEGYRKLQRPVVLQSIGVRDGQAGRQGVVIEDRSGGRACPHRRIDRVRQGHRERLVVLGTSILDHRHVDRVRDFARRQRQRPRRSGVVAARRGRTVRCGVVHGHLDLAGFVQRHLERQVPDRILQSPGVSHGHNRFVRHVHPHRYGTVVSGVGLPGHGVHARPVVVGAGRRCSQTNRSCSTPRNTERRNRSRADLRVRRRDPRVVGAVVVQRRRRGPLVALVVHRHQIPERPARPWAAVAHRWPQHDQVRRAVGVEDQGKVRVLDQSVALVVRRQRGQVADVHRGGVSGTRGRYGRDIALHATRGNRDGAARDASPHDGDG